MSEIKILPYSRHSASAKLLAEALGCVRLRPENSTYSYTPGDIVILWGKPPTPYRWARENNVVNRYYAVCDALNKLRTFHILSQKGVSIPEYTVDIDEAKKMAETGPVVCRKTLTGSEGEGIVIAETPDQVVPAGLYTKYIKKRYEFRVHVGRTSSTTFTTIDLTRKALKNGHQPHKVRNTANGYVFVRNGVVAPDQVIQEAYKAIDALDLDFGAVDVIWNEHHQRAYVLEVNTAPGIEGTTVNKYAEYFRGIAVT